MTTTPSPGAQQSLSATPFEMTDAFQDLFRVQNRSRRSCHFAGVVGTTDSLTLRTNVGDHTAASPIQLLVTPTGRPDFGFGAAAPSKPMTGSGARLLGQRLSRMNSVRGAVQRPIDSFMRMKIWHAGGEYEGIYTNGNAILRLPIELNWRPLPLVCSITLTNPNPINPVWFAFAVYFT